MPEPAALELLSLNQKLLDAITAGDWATYEKLCDPSLSAFEPEALGHLVEGLPFHKFYFDLGGVDGQHNTTMSSPHVRLMGDVAIVCYVRLNQRMNASQEPVVRAIEETRVWQKSGGQWRHVHFHRSPCGQSHA